jgi:hypothetical protein
MPVYAYVFSLDLYASPSTSRRRDDLFPPNSHRYHAFQQARGQRRHTQLAAGIAHSRPALPQASATQAEKTPAEGGQVFG